MTKNSEMARSLLFTGNHEVEILTHEKSSPGDNQVLIETLYSAISAGTEMLVYRGQLPQELDLDSSIKALSAPNT